MNVLSQSGRKWLPLALYSFAIVLNISVAWLEFWGHGETGSESLFADAWHVVSDGLTNGTGLAKSGMLVLALWVAYQDRIRRTLDWSAALIVFGAGSLMLMSSGDKLMNGELPRIVESSLLLGVAVAGLLANLFLLFLFHLLGVEHTHTHGHAHHHDNVLAMNKLHTAGDALGSILVIATAGLFLWSGDPRVGYFDLFASCAIAGWLMANAWKTLRHLQAHTHAHNHS